MKLNPVPAGNLRNVEEEITPPEQREKYWIKEDKCHGMILYKISNLLSDWTVSKFMTIKWVEVNGLPGGQYFTSKNIKLKTSMLGSGLSDYSDAYIVV